MLSPILAILAMGLAVGVPQVMHLPDAYDVAFARGRVFVPVWVNGAGPYPFLLDTAAPFVAIDRPIASAMALPETGEPERLDDFIAQPVQIPALAVAGWPATECEAYAADLSPMEAAYGFRVAGILGLPGLPERFRLDCAGKEIGRPPAEMGAEWAEIPVRTARDGVMRLPITLNGHHDIEAILDTAFAGTLALPESCAEQWGLLPQDAPVVRSLDTAGLASAFQMRLRECRLGPVKVLDPLCALQEGGEPRIGTRLLSRFDVVVDRANQRLYLRPLVALPWRDPPLVGAGLAPAEQVDGFWRLHVAEDSPAHMAGILPGDLLVSVDGADMVGQPFDAVQHALCGPTIGFIDIAVLREGAAGFYRVAIEELL